MDENKMARRLTERRDQILKLLMKNGEVSVKRLLEEMQVSDETIRKDLMAMEEQGTIVRKHGRVLLAGNFGNAPSPMRAKENQAIKEKIAWETLKHIPVNENVYIGMDVGSTTWNVAKLLVKYTQPMIITNSLDIANLYSNENNQNIYCAGGALMAHDRGFYGHWTNNNLKEIKMSIAIIGTSGIKDLSGLGAVSFMDRDVKKIFISNSEYRIAVFDSGKFTHGALIDAVPWEDIDLVISDHGATSEQCQIIEEKTKLILV